MPLVSSVDIVLSLSSNVVNDDVTVAVLNAYYSTKKGWIDCKEPAKFKSLAILIPGIGDTCYY